jgi:hypothetical protein
MTARERLRELAMWGDDRTADTLLDDYAVEVAHAERIAAYRAAADTAEYVASELLTAYDTEQGNGAMAVAARLRARADQMEQQ